MRIEIALEQGNIFLIYGNYSSHCTHIYNVYINDFFIERFELVSIKYVCSSRPYYIVLMNTQLESRSPPLVLDRCLLQLGNAGQVDSAFADSLENCACCFDADDLCAGDVRIELDVPNL